MQQKRSDEQWQTLFKRHEESRLSAAQFCRENKLCPKYFSLRKKQLLSEAPGKQPNVFVPAKVSQPMQNEIKLTVGTVTIILPTTVAAQWLADFLKRLQF